MTTATATATQLQHTKEITAEQFSVEYTKYFLRTQLYIQKKFHIEQTVAEEVTQWAWCRAWEKRSQHKENCSFFSWVCTIAQNRYIGEVLRHKDRIYEPLEETHKVESPQPENTQFVEEIKSKTKNKNWGLLELLAQGYTCVEIGELLHSPESTIRVRISRLRTEIKTNKNLNLENLKNVLSNFR